MVVWIWRYQKIRPLLISGRSGNNSNWTVVRETGDSFIPQHQRGNPGFFNKCFNVDPCFGWVKHVTITWRAELQLNPQGSSKCQGYICLWHAQTAHCNVWNEHVDKAKAWCLLRFRIAEGVSAQKIFFQNSTTSDMNLSTQNKIEPFLNHQEAKDWK